MANQKVIVVKQIDLAQATVHLIGTSPLIIHKFSDKEKHAILMNQTGAPKGPKDFRNPWQDAIDCTYWIEGKPEEYTQAAYNQAIINGARYGFPAIGFKISACSGAYRNKLSKDKVSLYGSFHIIGGEYVEIIGTPDVREDIVRIGNNQTDLRYRTWFKQWEVQFETQYNRETTTFDQILSYFEAGGFAVGVGDNRIEKGGTYGGYHVAIDNVSIRHLT